jgi:hypothetical protein
MRLSLLDIGSILLDIRSGVWCVVTNLCLFVCSCMQQTATTVSCQFRQSWKKDCMLRFHFDDGYDDSSSCGRSSPSHSSTISFLKTRLGGKVRIHNIDLTARDMSVESRNRNDQSSISMRGNGILYHNNASTQVK